MSGVQVPTRQGRANRLGPESCSSDGNVAAEALTGVRSGPVVSPEIRLQLSDADAVLTRARQHGAAQYGQGCTDPAGSETWAWSDIHRVRESGGPVSARSRKGRTGRYRKPKGYAADARTLAIG